MENKIDVMGVGSCEQTAKRFLDLLALTVPFNAPRLSEMMYLAWHPTLSSFSWQELNWYLSYAAENLTHFPPLSAIKKTLVERRNGFLNVDPFTALMAGCKNKLDVSEPINQLAAKFGGWTIVGQWPVAEWEWKRKSILENWEQVKKSNRIDGVKNPAINKNFKDQEIETPFVPRTSDEIIEAKKKIQSIINNLKNRMPFASQTMGTKK